MYRSGWGPTQASTLIARFDPKELQKVRRTEIERQVHEAGIKGAMHWNNGGLYFRFSQFCLISGDAPPLGLLLVFRSLELIESIILKGLNLNRSDA